MLGIRERVFSSIGVRYGFLVIEGFNGKVRKCFYR